MQQHFENLQNGFVKHFAICIRRGFIIRFAAPRGVCGAFFCKFAYSQAAKARFFLKPGLHLSAISPRGICIFAAGTGSVSEKTAAGVAVCIKKR